MILVLGFIFVISSYLFFMSSRPGLYLYSDQDIDIKEISSNLFNEIANKSKENKFNPIEYDGGYLNIDGHKYLMTSLEKPYYAIFDYGIISKIGSLGPGLEGFYFYDIKNRKILQISDCWECAANYFPSNDYLILQYQDKSSYSGDVQYNRDQVIALFTKAGKTKLISKYVRLEYQDKTSFGKSFWADNKFYFSIQDEYYSVFNESLIQNKYYFVDIINDSFNPDNIYYKRNMPLLGDRDVTDMNPLRVISMCRENKSEQGHALVLMGSWNGEDYETKKFLAECITQTAVENKYPPICEEISVNDEKRNESRYTRFKEDCYYEVALETEDIKLCDKVPNMEHKDWMQNRDKCIMNIAVAKNDSGICSFISLNLWYKEDCYNNITK